MTVTVQEIVGFWFSDEVKKLWFNSNETFDETIRNMFEPTYHAGVNGLLKKWEETAQGGLALVILFDQFPLNMYRGDKKGFATELLSRDIAQAAIDKGFDQEMTNAEKSFLYMPFMHSENIEDQRRGALLFEAAGLVDNAKFASHHRSIVERFGRFPHRNKILGRKNSDAEACYLNSEEAFLG